MQLHKITNNISELETIAGNSEKLTSSLTDVMDRFNTKEHFAMFDFLKSKGLAISSLINILLILPFYAVANVYSLVKCGIKGTDFQCKKDVYYDLKNNEFIDWRKLLFLHAKRFMYLINHNINLKSLGITALIFDDTLLEKTGTKIEKGSIVHDHVSGRYILGFKLLVCGFWDGASFIPLDFSLHRERGTKQDKLIKASRKATKAVNKQREIVQLQDKDLKNKELKLSQVKLSYQNKPNKTNKKKYDSAEQSCQKAETKLKDSQNDLTLKEKVQTQAAKELKRSYSSGSLFGLTTQQRKEQYKKAVSTKSSGFGRRKEADKDKISMMIEMLCRAVKHGIIPDYVLTDSWFFCYKILETVTSLRKGIIKLVSMVKINKQIFTLCETGKDLSVKNILKAKERKASTCKSLKCKYIKVKCFYKDQRVNLFFIRMGKCQTWNLLLTTDLELNFIKLMEVYQIRWSIEIFFKECKQYLHLGGCQSVNFDAQIAETTLTMMQHMMLSYFKRINYQQSFGELFKAVSHELIELDLVTRLINIFWELINILCEYSGFNFIEFQKDAIRNDDFMKKFAKLLPNKVLEKAA